MKLSVFAHTFMDKSIEETLDIVKAMGIETIEIGSGGYIGKNHCNPQLLLADNKKLTSFKDAFESRGIELSCLSAHGNPVHPDETIAREHADDIKASIDLASKLDVKTVVTFSGCPGDHEGATQPNWIVYPWPLYAQDILKYQWEKKLIPYWKKIGAYAADKGVNIAIEMHGNFAVSSPATMIRLREETGQKSIGANVDPSHLWWQGIDPVVAIRYLGKIDCIYYFHAKDTGIDPVNVNYYGLTDPQSFTNVGERGWQFRTIGYGHDMNVWANILSSLRMVGYDDFISIEHEDGLMSSSEGLLKAIANIKSLILEEKAVAPSMLTK